MKILLISNGRTSDENLRNQLLDFNKRLSHYWLDGKNDEVHSLKYDQIDSLKAVDRTKAATYASYLEVYGANKYNFKIYVDNDSARTWDFFNKAIENWNNKK